MKKSPEHLPQHKRDELERLGRKAAGYNAEFAKVFPCAMKQEDKAYKLLKRAYIDARYKKEYRITRKQLEYLI